MHLACWYGASIAGICEMPKLTKTYIDRVQPPAAEYEIHWDGGHDSAVKGYGLRVTASGVKAFVAQGRVKGKGFACGPIPLPVTVLCMSVEYQSWRRGGGTPCRFA